MITEEQITKAAMVHAEYLDFEHSSGENICPTLAKAFTQGIGWFKDTLWHTAKEEPAKFEDIIYIDVNGEFGKVWTDLEWSEKCKIYDIQKWCYCKDLIL